MDPARMCTESLTPNPELENSLDPKETLEQVTRPKRLEKASAQEIHCGAASRSLP